uniref:snRNA-activating protein complex subunit isoform X2 n=1 Tax=Elaeis guineensis var. tenera TaxID=51953 RepID=A0A6I9R7B0_ELAGV|nr:snRNA-activating protein complex subunit isoform X2 [Elaeis guineensis]
MEPNPVEEVAATAATTAEEEEYRYQDQGSRLPFARGGPIYVPDLVSPLTSVPDFKASALQELQSLEAELEAPGDFDEELSVDELRVFTEEELVEKALKEDFEGIWGIDDSSQLLEYPNGGTIDNTSTSGKEIVCSANSELETSNMGAHVTSNDSSVMTCDTDVSSKKSQEKKGKKRGRRFDRDSRAAELEGSYFAKVKQLARIKQKQDEDKLAARLHSLSDNSKSVQGSISTSEKIESMRSLRFITSPVKVKSLKSREHVPIFYPEVVLCIEIYHNKNSSLKTQEFLVLGSQTLNELRDNIYCLTDKLMEIAGQSDPSGYFLIEDTFYNDQRNHSSIDYSKPIFDWLKNFKNEAAEKWEYIMSGELKKKQKQLLGDLDIFNLPSFKAVHMHRTRFADLRFRLGAGYLYCHQGNCKHIIVIRDMRMIHPEDVQNQSDYPLLTFQLRPRQQKCSVCKIYHATKMTVDDKWSPKNPCYLCIKCYFLLHYKEDNSLLYPHAVFDYFHE